MYYRQTESLNMNFRVALQPKISNFLLKIIIAVHSYCTKLSTFLKEGFFHKSLNKLLDFKEYNIKKNGDITNKINSNFRSTGPKNYLIL